MLLVSVLSSSGLSLCFFVCVALLFCNELSYLKTSQITVKCNLQCLAEYKLDMFMKFITVIDST